MIAPIRYPLFLCLTYLLFATQLARADYMLWDGSKTTKVNSSANGLQADWGFTWVSKTNGRESYNGGYDKPEAAVKALESRRRLERTLNRYFRTDDQEYSRGSAPVARLKTSVLGPVGATLIKQKLEKWKSTTKGVGWSLIENFPAFHGLGAMRRIGRIAMNAGTAVQTGTGAAGSAKEILEELDVKMPPYIDAFQKANSQINALEGMINADPTIPGLGSQIERFDRKIEAQMKTLDAAYQRTPRIYKDFDSAMRNASGWGFGGGSNGPGSYVGVTGLPSIEVWSRQPSSFGTSGGKYQFWRARNKGTSAVTFRYKLFKGQAVEEEGTVTLVPGEESSIFWGEIVANRMEWRPR